MKKGKRFTLLVLSVLFAVTMQMAAGSDLNCYFRKLQGEVIYFVMPDRFNNGNQDNDYGDYVVNPDVDPAADSEVLVHGFKEENRAYYHGGDIRGIIKKLGYLKSMGVTAIWITPIFKNNAVQGDGTVEGSSAAHHGYWITDFMQVDPHLGTNDDFKELVSLAHSMGIKVFMDIITNHSADVIKYDASSYDYISKQTSAYKDADGNEFNDLDYALSYQNQTPFPELNLNSFPYTPVVPEGMENVKNPAWLNNPIYYHNRGNSTFSGENSVYGDFDGLDDLFTAHPAVVEGMIEIYKYWIKEFGVDGFRIDTVKHVNIEFWQQFAPEVLAFARSEGIEDFYMFGEVYSGNPTVLSNYTTAGKLPAVLDFGFQGAALAFANQNQPTDNLRDFFIADDYYTDADSDVYSLPTFLGNHDMGRVGAMIARDHQDESDDMLLKRDILAHSLMFMSRGNPTVYYGDEQGFTGVVPLENGGLDIHDQVSRQNMFPAQSDEYTNPVWNKQIGTDSTPADDNFDRSHPLYKKIRTLSRLRRYVPALATGSQIHRYSTDDETGDVYAFSRILKGQNVEYVVALNNNAGESRSALVPTFLKNTPYMRIYPRPRSFWDALKSVRFSNSRGEVEITTGSMDMVVYTSLRRLPSYNRNCPEITITSPAGQFQSGKFWLEAELSYDEFAEVSFYVEEPGNGWTFVGKDDNAPYRVNYDSNDLPLGSEINIKAVVKTYTGVSKSALREGVKIENRMPAVTIQYENGNSRETLSGVFSMGQQVYPQAVKADGFLVNWIAGSTELVLMYETRKADGSFEFDKPVVVSLLDDVYPYLEEVGDGTVKAAIYINSNREISGSQNYTGTAPEVMPYDLNAADLVTVPLYVRGGLNGWGTDNEMVYQGNYTYKTDIVLADGDQEFKFADANWSAYNFGAAVSANGLTLGSNPANLKSAVPFGKSGLYTIRFFVFPSLTGEGDFFTFYRFEQIPGPLNTDMFLNITGDELSRMQYIGEGQYQTVKKLTAGTYSLTVGDNAGENDIVFAAADAAGANLVLDQANAVSQGGTILLQLAAGFDAEYQFTLDVSDEDNPTLTVVSLIDHGPYGAIYLRGGSAVSPSGWDANSGNLFTYDDAKKTLTLGVEITSASQDDGDWQFKIATGDWAFQLTGTSGDWYHADNEVVADTPYTLGNGLQTLYIQKETGNYTFTINVSDSDNPVLTITK